MSKEEVLKFIEFNVGSDFAETVSVKKDCYFIMLRILYKYGFKDKLYKEPLLLAKDFINFKKTEVDIYNYILENIDSMDIDEIYYLLEEIDELHETTFFRVDKDLADMEVGLEMNAPHRIKRSRYSDLFAKLTNYSEEVYNLKGITI